MKANTELLKPIILFICTILLIIIITIISNMSIKIDCYQKQLDFNREQSYNQHSQIEAKLRQFDSILEQIQ